MLIHDVSGMWHVLQAREGCEGPDILPVNVDRDHKVICKGTETDEYACWLPCLRFVQLSDLIVPWIA